MAKSALLAPALLALALLASVAEVTGIADVRPPTADGGADLLDALVEAPSERTFSAQLEALLQRQMRAKWPEEPGPSESTRRRWRRNAEEADEAIKARRRQLRATVRASADGRTDEQVDEQVEGWIAGGVELPKGSPKQERWAAQARKEAL